MMISRLLHAQRAWWGLLTVALAFALGPAHAQQADSIRFAVIGDYGQAGPAEQDVATLVRSWNPDFILTVGDNNYENGEASTIDANIGQYFYEYICPYYGHYGQQTDPCENRFFPTLGNHDWRATGAQPYLDYFTLPGNERTYDFAKGPVHFFALDSDPTQPNAIADLSAQYSWLGGALAGSASPWKLVYFHHAPYSTGASSVWMRWPFKAWGASAVLAGHYHNYERLIVDGLSYVVNGAGGSTLYKSGAPISGSQVLFDSDYGAMLAEADAERMDLRFYTRTGLLVDVARLYAEAETAPTVRFNPATASGGSVVTATLSLDGPAPAGGLLVALGTDMPAVLQLPASVTVPEGALSVDVPVSTGATALPVAATLMADFGSLTRKAALTVLPPALSGLTLPTTKSVGGLPATGSVVLTGPAPDGGMTVQLTSDLAAARVPASVTVPAGATSAPFPISTDPVTLDTPANIAASLGYVTKSVKLTLMPLLKTLSLSPSSVTGGLTSKGTVTLNAASPEGGTAVSLASAAPQAGVPATVTVPAGATTAAFTIATSPVAANVIVPISATFAGVTRSATLTVKPPAVSSLALSPTSVTGGSPSKATVTLNGLAPEGGVVVTLASANAGVATLPATVSVPAGTKTASVTVTTWPVVADTPVALTASLNGTSKSATLTVKIPVVSALSLSPTTVTGSGTSKATVTLNSTAPPEGVSVTLSSANSSVAAIPVSIVVAGGAKTASVTVTTSPVATDTPVALTAALNGVSKAATLTVKAPAVSSLAVSPSSLPGGNTSKATVTLTGLAPASGVTVSLFSANGAVAALPATVNVPAGSKTASVTVATVPVAADTPVALTASLNGMGKSATLTVKAPVVSSLGLSPSSVIGGGVATATVTLSGNAPSPGVTVLLSSTLPLVAAVPAFVNVVAGAKTATVTVTTSTVAVDTVATLSAALNGVSKTAKLTMKQ